MNRTYRLTVFCLLLCLVWLTSCHAEQTSLQVPTDNLTVYFSPKGGCTQAIVEALTSATSSVYVQAYSFTSVPIAKALVDAHKRGVHVEVVLDKSQRGERYTSATFVFNAGIPTFIDSKHSIAHNKVIVIDEEKVITGSFNFSKAAEESNAENLLIIKSKDLAKKYLLNWQAHMTHSEVYEKK